MNNMHKTADWKVMFISQMDDSHLNNMIKILLKSIKDCINIINNVNMWNNLDLLLAGIDDQSMKERAKENLQEVYWKLWNYLIEAYIRWMDFKDDMQDAFGRKEQQKNLDTLKQALTQKYYRWGNLVIDVDDFDDHDDY